MVNSSLKNAIYTYLSSNNSIMDDMDLVELLKVKSNFEEIEIKTTLDSLVLSGDLYRYSQDKENLIEKEDENILPKCFYHLPQKNYQGFKL